MVDFLSTDPDPVNGLGTNFNRYAYAGNNPYKYVDPDGRIVDTILDVGFVAYSSYTLATEPSWTNAAALGADIVGAIVPFATGLGAGVRAANVGADAARGVNTASDASRIADDALVVRGGAATPNGGNLIEGIAANIEKGAANGIDGFSAEARTGASLCELCANIPQNSVGVTTAGKIRQLGGDVIPKPGRSPNHVTVTNLSPKNANKLLTPTVDNPVPKNERKF